MSVRHVHDPCMAKADGHYYVYSTGAGIPIRRSPDLIHWERIGRVFTEDVPAWAREVVPGSRGIWAPDIAFFRGRFHLYYAVSTFGSNRSVIGLATNTTLDPSCAEYDWVDEGEVLRSDHDDGYNAIDPNLVFVSHDQVALAFGSFWSGIKMIRLDHRTGKPEPGAVLVSLARHPPSTAIEAPFLMRRGPYFYLFVSWDFCCRGAGSTYNIRVGRARQAAGPYRDREGKPMLDGGGTLVLGTEGDMIGPGGCSVYQGAADDLLVHHFYDGGQNGVPTLQIRPLIWTPDGWPVAGRPLAQATGE
ncbi:MAG: arabinan endo-1,5-alpha-L-arabinosidase [Armatimonadetes bacterium]|nr:arabinan endo-1,5-alpha-L-arabinosidase [Armatimonadota bacterium]